MFVCFCVWRANYLFIFIIYLWDEKRRRKKKKVVGEWTFATASQNQLLVYLRWRAKIAGERAFCLHNQIVFFFLCWLKSILREIVHFVAWFFHFEIIIMEWVSLKQADNIYLVGIGEEVRRRRRRVEWRVFGKRQLTSFRNVSTEIIIYIYLLKARCFSQQLNLYTFSTSSGVFPSLEGFILKYKLKFPLY